MAMVARNLPIQPGPGRLPLAFDGGGRDTHNFRGLLDAQSTEEAQFDDAALPRVDDRQAHEGIIESNDVEIGGYCDTGVKRQSLLSRSTLPGSATARVIHQDATHHLGGHCEEVGTIPQVPSPLPHEPQVGFMHQCRRLQGVMRPFVSQVASRKATQFGIHGRQQLVQRRPIAAAPRGQ